MEEIFNKDYFTKAIEAIFADLGPAQAMFGADGESPNVSASLPKDRALQMASSFVLTIFMLLRRNHGRVN